MTQSPTDNEKGSQASVTPIDKDKRGGDKAEDELKGIEKLASVFESSAKRWEVIVYPILFVFIILASFGFYLIYSLSHDVASLARNVSVLTQSIDTNMDTVARRMGAISIDVKTLSGDVGSMTGQMANLTPMRDSMESITTASRHMAVGVTNMQHSVGSLNRNVGGPVSRMSSFFPW